MEYQINKFTHAALTGKECLVEDSFAPLLKELCDKAEELLLKIYITSSHRYTIVVPGAIVTPAKMSNHLIGHAIDGNIVEKGAFWNSQKLEGELTGKVLELIEWVREHPVLRWGGDFAKRDVVHFDDAFNIKSPDQYKEILKSLETKNP